MHCKDLLEDFTRIFRRSSHKDLRDAHFVRVCAVEMHMDISQEPCRPRICRKKAGAQDLDNPVTHILPEPGQSKCARISLCVQKLLCVKYSLTLCKSFSKLLCVKAKSFSVQKLLCAKASVCKSIRVHPHSPSPSPSRLPLSLSPSLSLSPLVLSLSLPILFFRNVGSSDNGIHVDGVANMPQKLQWKEHSHRNYQHLEYARIVKEFQWRNLSISEPWCNICKCSGTEPPETKGPIHR